MTPTLNAVVLLVIAAALMSAVLDGIRKREL
jgi:hypothetical protein